MFPESPTPNVLEKISTCIGSSIINEISKISKVKLLDVDMGYDTNRTVVTLSLIHI